MNQDELRKKLTPSQYACTQEDATERPFENPFWNHKEDGIYVDVVSGETLFSSMDKFDSGTGWPSFTQPLDKNNVVQLTDHKHGMERTEVRSLHADSHLGHVFPDGPKPLGSRFCINSASLRFIPIHDLKKEGYGQYLFSFAKKKSWEIATFAGGCFWGMEEIFGKQAGIIETQVGYSGGQTLQPNYESICTGKTGHAEAIQILFDPKQTSYEQLLDLFFKMHDPTTLNQQGNDRGTQYRSAIFFENESQHQLAEKYKAKASQLGIWKNSVVTEISPITDFWRAEENHQKYHEKNPHGYTCHYIRQAK